MAAGPQRASPSSSSSDCFPHSPFAQPTCWHIYVFNKQHDRLKMSARLSTVIQNVTTASRRIREPSGRRRMRREEWAQWAQDALDYLTFCMAHRIMNEINLILAINALVVSKFRQCLVPPSQSAQATLCLSLLTRECCCLSLALTHFALSPCAIMSSGPLDRMRGCVRA